MSRLRHDVLPVAVIVILLVWYAAAVWLNSAQVIERFGNDGTTWSMRDLMHSYAASPAQTLRKLRLPTALPFVFNALRINSTLALISAIVAEFFGSPILGLGFRISAEVARLNVDVVWAAIAIAALAGSLFYGLIAVMERALTFWHPSYRT